MPPSPTPKYPPTQSRGLSLLLASAGIAAATLAWHGLVGIIPLDQAWSSMAARLGTAALALLPGAAVLWLMIVAQMLARMVSGRFNPTEGRDNIFLLTNQRAIGNTTEQSLCFYPALLALAAGVSGPQMPFVIALALVFAAARLVFWAGYLVRPVLRAPGMAATLASVTATIAGAVWTWLP